VHTPNLFDPLTIGDLELRNRIVMAPMTRNRADVQGVPTAMMATYYGQRASAGLIVSESAPILAQAVGYPCTPGLHTQDQVLGWRLVTEAVHAGGGQIFAQLQHCGRISHPSFQLDGGEPVAPSALRPIGQAATNTGMQDFVTPGALQSGEIPAVIDQFKKAAQTATQLSTSVASSQSWGGPGWRTCMSWKET
jgi:N-ethylmaleimide reductase